MKNVLVVLFFMFICFNVSLAEEYHFVSIEKLIEQEVGRIIIPEIYKKLGIKVTITPFPGKRAQLEATTGKKDGEIMRIWTYGKENPTTIRVPTPYYYLETMAFIKKNSSVKIKSKKDLGKYKLLKVRGVKHTNNITQGMSKVIDVKNTERMMRMLQKGYGEVALTNTVDGMIALKKLGYTNIIPLGKPLAVLGLYNYIHEDHKDLVPKVDKVIKEMKSSGELQKIIRRAEIIIIGR